MNRFFPAVFSPASALRHFGFKQSLRAAIIIGVLSSFMLVVQGLAYQKSYPDGVTQAKFAATLSSVPALGLIYGDVKNLAAGTNGYIVYRVTGFMGLITAVWGLMAATRLLRGNEEDGRWEVLRTGAISANQTTLHVASGLGLAWLMSFAISTLMTIGVVGSSDLNLSLSTILTINLIMFLPGLLFMAVGVFTSQLALTRQRALLYGLIPLIGFFLLRGLANTNYDLHWLMVFTPFGWMELISPVLKTQIWWSLLPVIFSGLFFTLGLQLSDRDLGSSVIKQSDTSRSRYFLLGNTWQLGLRQNLVVLGAWIVGAIVLSALMASISSIAASVTSDSKSLSHSIGNLSGNSNDITIAFLGAGLVFLVMILMVLTTTIIHAIRADEAKQYLDTILVQPSRRTTWLASRLAVGLAIILFISVLASFTTYAIANSHNIPLSLGKVLAAAVCLTGTVIFLAGLGTLLYGLKPRVAGLVMYAILGWSFLIILLSSTLHLSSIILHSSLLHYASFNLATYPDWTTFAWLVILGLGMAALGIAAFAKRDIIPE